jgi:hypothetical protein
MLGMIFLMSALTTYRSGLIVRELRAAAMPPIPDDDDQMPPSTAAAIIDRVRAVWPKANARTTAQHTLRIFEALNARPPGWLATLGLGTVYLGGIVLAAVALLGLTTGEYLLRPYLEPRGTVDDSVVIAPPAGAFPADGHALLVATYDDSDAARAAHAALATDRALGNAVGLFGQSVIVSTPAGAARHAHAASLTDAAELVGAAKAAEISVSLTCHTADPAAATALNDTLAQFFELPTDRLIPPWAHPDPRSPAEVARHQWARQAWTQIDPRTSLYDTPQWVALGEQFDEAEERGDAAALAALGKRMGDLRRAAEQRAIAELQSAGTPDTNREFLDAYAAALATVAADDTESGEIWAPVLYHLGTIPAGNAADALRRQAASDGTPSVHGRLVRVDDVRFADVVHGPVALAAWLRAAGCGDQHYAFED